MSEAGFNAKVENARLTAGQSLPSSCFDDFQRLSRTLVYGPSFQWLLVDAPDEHLRRKVMMALEKVLRAAGLRSNSLPLSGHINDVAELERRLLKNAGQAEVVHVVGRSGWFTEARWDAFNVRRERLAAESRARLVFWLDADAIALASRGAPDLWAWRGGVYSFVQQGVSRQSSMGQGAIGGFNHGRVPVESLPSGFDNRAREARLLRIAEIQKWLATQPPPPDELLAAPVDELGHLLFSLGDYDAALAHWSHVEVPMHTRLGDVRSLAITKGKIADILQARGQLDEALRILQEELLPSFELLGDVRSLAVAKGKIADILQNRGQLDEALRIGQEEQLPVFQQLGDVRSLAVTKGKIADILQARDQLDEALRIRQEEELPVYQQLGDVRSLAVTKGKIADILQDRGQLDEALRIRQEEQLPVYQQLGDVRSLAVAKGKIADILQARGQLDEALRIRQEEELPIFQQLGDVRELAVAKGKIAEILQARGQLDEALRIFQEELLPIFQQLGDVRSTLVCQVKIALNLAQRGHRDDGPEIARLLRAAHAPAQRLGLPEAAQIEGIFQKIFGRPLPPAA